MTTINLGDGNQSVTNQNGNTYKMGNTAGDMLTVTNSSNDTFVLGYGSNDVFRITDSLSTNDIITVGVTTTAHNSDSIYALDGNFTLTDNNGVGDVISFGNGNDTLVFNNGGGYNITLGNGNDSITIKGGSGGSTITLGSGTNILALTDAGGDTINLVGAGGVLTISSSVSAAMDSINNLGSGVYTLNINSGKFAINGGNFVINGGSGGNAFNIGTTAIVMSLSDGGLDVINMLGTKANLTITETTGVGDTFNLGTGTYTLTINGGVGNNTINQSISGNVTINDSDSGGDTFNMPGVNQTANATNTYNISGNNGGDTFILNDGSYNNGVSTFNTISKINLSASNNNNIILGNGNDVINLADGSHNLIELITGSLGGNITVTSTTGSNNVINLGSSKVTITLGSATLLNNGGGNIIILGNNLTSTDTIKIYGGSGDSNQIVGLGNFNNILHLGTGVNSVTLADNGNDYIDTAGVNHTQNVTNAFTISGNQVGDYFVLNDGSYFDGTNTFNTNNNVTLSNGSSHNTITLGNGNDTIKLDAGSFNVVGGLASQSANGNVTVTATTGSFDSITLGDGSDTVTLGTSTVANGGNNTITLGDDNDLAADKVTIYGGGNNTITLGSGKATVTLNDAGGDTISNQQISASLINATNSGTIITNTYNINGNTTGDTLNLSDGTENVFVRIDFFTFNFYSYTTNSNVNLNNSSNNVINIGSGTDVIKLDGGSYNTVNADVFSFSNDTVTASSGSHDTINLLGAGNNTITLGTSTVANGGFNNINLGDGTNKITIYGASNNNQLTLGNGSNTVTLGTSAVSSGTGNIINLGFGLDAITINGGSYDTINAGASASKITLNNTNNTSITFDALDNTNLYGQILVGNTMPSSTVENTQWQAGRSFYFGGNSTDSITIDVSIQQYQDYLSLDASHVTSLAGQFYAFQSINLDVKGYYGANIIITPPPPVANPDNNNITEGSSVSPALGNVLSNDVNPFTSPLTVSEVNGSAANVGSVIVGTYGNLVLNADGSYTYTLNNNVVPDGQTQDDLFTYKAQASANSTSDLTTLDITVNGAAPPVAMDDSNSIAEASNANFVNGNVLSNDTESWSSPLVVDQVNGNAAGVGATVAGAYGSLVLNADGSYQYTLGTVTPNDNQSAYDQFVYETTDGFGGYSTATLSILVSGAAAPVAMDDSSSINAGSGHSPISSNVLANDTNSYATPLTVSAVNGSANNVGNAIAGAYGTLTLNADGSYTYAENNNLSVNGSVNLQDQFNYQMTDGHGGFSTANLNITLVTNPLELLGAANATSNTFSLQYADGSFNIGAGVYSVNNGTPTNYTQISQFVVNGMGAPTTLAISGLDTRNGDSFTAAPNTNLNVLDLSNNPNQIIFNSNGSFSQGVVQFTENYSGFGELIGSTRGANSFYASDPTSLSGFQTPNDPASTIYVGQGLGNSIFLTDMSPVSAFFDLTNHTVSGSSFSSTHYQFFHSYSDIQTFFGVNNGSNTFIGSSAEQGLFFVGGNNSFNTLEYNLVSTPAAMTFTDFSGSGSVKTSDLAINDNYFNIQHFFGLASGNTTFIGSNNENITFGGLGSNNSMSFTNASDPITVNLHLNQNPHNDDGTVGSLTINDSFDNVTSFTAPANAVGNAILISSTLNNNNNFSINLLNDATFTDGTNTISLHGFQNMAFDQATTINVSSLSFNAGRSFFEIGHNFVLNYSNDGPVNVTLQSAGGNSAGYTISEIGDSFPADFASASVGSTLMGSSFGHNVFNLSQVVGNIYGGGGSSNTLNYSGASSALNFNFNNGSVSENSMTDTFNNIQIVKGSSTNSNNYAFGNNDLTSSPFEIANFSLANDNIDLSQVVPNSGQTEAVRFAITGQANNNTAVQVSVDSGATYSTVAILDNILPTDNIHHT